MIHAHPVRRLLAWAALLLGLVSPIAVAQQGLPAPRTSSQAQVTGMLGLTEVRADYSRPGVKGRVIWGELVPYGSLWRAGANENTTISFSSDVLFGGKPVPAGTYSYHVIPFRDRPWTVVLNEATDLFGSFGYDKARDMARVEVQPEPAPHEEWMRFDVRPIDDRRASLDLCWEELRLSVPLEVDLDVSRQAVVRALLDGPRKDDPVLLASAARWSLERDAELELALAWAERAVALQKSFSNIGLQAELLERLGRSEDAAPLKKEAWLVATEADLSTFSGQLISNRQYAEAVPVCEFNVRKHPKSWKAYDQLGEAARKSGQTAKAVEAYARALELAPDDDARVRLETTLAELRGT